MSNVNLTLGREETTSQKITSFLTKNMVTIFFMVISIAAFLVSGTSLDYLAKELFTRIGRNSFIVLSLIIPVLTGMGLNFSVVIGAIAAQVGVFVIVNHGLTGISGFLVCVLIATPLAGVLGFLVGQLFNKMKGGEMIGGLVLGYFSDGLYQFFFLFVMGGIIPIINQKLTISGAIGVINVIDLDEGLKYVLDKIPLITVVDIGFYVVLAISALSIIYNCVFRKKSIAAVKGYIIASVVAVAVFALSFVPAVSTFLSADRLVLLDAITLTVVVGIVYQIAAVVSHKLTNQADSKSLRARIIAIVGFGVLYGITYIPAIEKAVLNVKIPVMTYLLILALYLFNSWIMRTKLGQNMRTVGQSMRVANAAGINVDKTRAIAMVFSTVLASWGQLIYLQNLGTVQTYGAHNQVGLYAIASLLVGGASVQKATSKQAIVGVILFHTLVVLSPRVGTTLFNDAQIGEYFRVFVTYGVIAISLAMHAYNASKRRSLERAAHFNGEDSKATA